MVRGDYTKQRFVDTFLRMCDTQKLSDITVTSLIAEAHTARQTFYNHFEDINGLVSYIPINFMEEFWRPAYYVETVREAYYYAYEHKGFFCQLPQHAGQNNFRDTFIEHYREILHRTFVTDDLSPEEQIYRSVAIEQLVIGVVDTFLEWCRQQMSWPVDVLVRVQHDATPAFIRQMQHGNARAACDAPKAEGDSLGKCPPPRQTRRQAPAAAPRGSGLQSRYSPANCPRRLESPPALSVGTRPHLPYCFV